jgi:hypothetical protein
MNGRRNTKASRPVRVDDRCRTSPNAPTNEGSRRNIAPVTVATRRSATNPSLTVDITLTNNANSLYGNIFLTEY